ncbi:MAG: FtsX-like permease family protein [Bacteroidetes bacterium]|jgi:putative ABC transport system permease protein|nr:FtsX-like permease family protein [Bacteroidota bacterium]
MFLQNLKQYIIEIRSNRLITVINVVGYSIGLAACILIGSYTIHQLSYNNFHEHSERIFRLNYYQSQKNNHNATTNHQWAQVIPEEIPEVDKVARYDWPWERDLSFDSKVVKANGCMGDGELFQIFSFPLIHGNQESIFSEKQGIAISESVAKKLFGHTDVLGKSLILEVEDKYTITAVFKDIPANSSIRFEYLINAKDQIAQWNSNSQNHWLMWRWRTFVMLHDQDQVEAFEGKMPALQKKHIGNWHADVFNYSLQPLKDIHLGSSHIRGSFNSDNKISTLYIFASIGVLILLIACFNFINLTTTSFEDRKKSISIKKMIGANRKTLFFQYLFYSILLTIICVLIGILLSKQFLPELQRLSGDSIQIPFNNVFFWIAIILFSIIIGTLAGIYPALFIARKVSLSRSNDLISTFGVRNTLVVFQFAITIGLLSFIGIVKKQLNLSTKGDLGYHYTSSINFWNSENTFNHYDAFHQEMAKIPGVISSTSCNFSLPGHFGNFWGVKPKGLKENVEIFHAQAATDFFEVMEIPLNKQIEPLIADTTQQADRCVINQQAYQLFAMEDDILGNQFKIGETKNTVIAVMSDFHNNTLHEKVKPLSLSLQEKCWNNLVQIDQNRINETLTAIKQLWSKFEEKYPFDYQFVDQSIARRYEREQKLMNLISLFFGLAIFISLLGLYGLMRYIAQYRTKEIGIRKVNGAKWVQIIQLLNVNMVRTIIIAFIIGCPLAYYFMHKWLEKFAYKTEISWWIFAISGFVALCIALLTVSWQSWRAASRNPVEALRYE